jgi:flagellar basal-body rod protein FlgB
MLFDNQFTEFGKALDLQQQRLGVITNNLANADTPHYKAKRLRFEEDLRQASGGGDGLMEVRRTHDQHLSFHSGDVSQVQGEMEEIAQGGRLDGNTVNTQQELERLGQTRLEYQMVSKLTSRRVKGLEYAIKQGGR